uniref:Uncharacterized protein n=1 Tax=Magallana gigas TaxID=29159 RepID=K1Q1N6_MAGGI
MSKIPSHGPRKPAPKSAYLEMMKSTAAGKTDQDRPLPTGAKGGRPRTIPPKESLLLTPPSYNVLPQIKLRRWLSALDKKELVRGFLPSKSAHKYMSSDEEGRG